MRRTSATQIISIGGVHTGSLGPNPLLPGPQSQYAQMHQLITIWRFRGRALDFQPRGRQWGGVRVGVRDHLVCSRRCMLNRSIMHPPTCRHRKRPRLSRPSGSAARLGAHPYGFVGHRLHFLDECESWAQTHRRALAFLDKLDACPIIEPLSCH